MPDATDLHERVQSAPRAETVPQIDFAYVFSALRKRIVLVAAITLLFMIGSIALSMLMTNYYTASTSILVDPEGSRIVEGEINSGTTATEARALNQQFILTSGKVLSSVVESEGLADDPEFGAAKPFELDARKRAQKALESLRRATSATLNKSSFVVDLAVTTNDPAKSARLANAIARSYIDTRISMKNGVLRQATSDLSAQLASLEKAVEDGDRAVQAYKAEHNLVDVAGRPTAEQQITEANTEISRISASIADNRALISELALARSNPEYLRLTPDASLTPAIIELRTRYLMALEQQTVLRSSFGERHPAFRNAESRTRTISNLLDKQLADFETSLTRNGEKLRSQLEILRANLAALKNGLNENDESMVRLRELERKLASDRLVYESFLLRTRQLSGQEQTVSENPQIISPAQVPLRKSGPQRSLIVAGATILGFLLGCGIALSSGDMGRREKTERSGSQTPLPASGQASSDMGKRRRLFPGFSWFSRSKETRRVPTGISANSTGVSQASFSRGSMLDSTSQLEAPGQPDDYLEIGRKLARDAHGRNNYSIGIYSALTQDKSHQTAFHAAMALARSGKRLLLVDADPAAELTRFVSLDGYPGFLDALSLNRISDDFIPLSDTRNFQFMPAGQARNRAPDRRTNPGASLLDFRASTLTDWLDEAGYYFDLVLIFAGPASASRSLPAAEAGVNKYVVLGRQSDLQSVGEGLSSLKRRGLHPIEPVFIDGVRQSVAHAG